MKNHTVLKFKIADKILIINKYILLILLEKRENPVNIGRIFDRKVFLTSLFSKAEAGGAEFAAELKEKLIKILESDKTIINILTERKEDTAGKISMLRNLSAAVKAYGVS